MSTKIYNGISGVLKIICAVFFGIVLGSIGVFQWGESLPDLNTTHLTIIPSIIRLILAIAGCIGILFRGLLQVKSLSKPCEENRIVAFFIDVVTAILIYLSLEDIAYAADVFRIDVVLIMSIYMAIAFIVIIAIDAIVLLIGMCMAKEKIFNEGTCTHLIKTIQRTVIPSFVVGVFALIIGMAAANIKQQELLDSLRGGFESFTMTDFDGNEYTEEMFQGHKITMINIWGTFCHPCIEEMPYLDAISKMYDEKDLQIVGLTGDIYPWGGTEIVPEQIDVAKDIIEKTGVEYTVLIPSKEIQLGPISELTGYPTSIFFNEKGEQIGVVVGGRTQEAWIEIIEEYMANEN